ncbi:hypothetical protein ACLI09_04915 [Flavobacterium sp. RHBU_24]|uniref:hypothetical protein n=1 Tax=Flavobacterium sp. RHBU_24 TaxID=3391185 RepID=UPI003984F65A
MKKTILLLVCVFYTLSVLSQGNNFAVLNGKLIWESVIISQETNIPAVVATHTKLAITGTEGNIYKGKATGLSSSCGDTSKILEREYNFNFEIELSESKYRITVTDIVFTGKGGGRAEAFYIDKYGSERLPATAGADLACLDAYFTKLFTMTRVYKTKS